MVPGIKRWLKSNGVINIITNIGSYFARGVGYIFICVSMIFLALVIGTGGWLVVETVRDYGSSTWLFIEDLVRYGVLYGGILGLWGTMLISY